MPAIHLMEDEYLEYIRAKKKIKIKIKHKIKAMQTKPGP